MQSILKLDLAGQPRGWLTIQEAVTAYARGDVMYGIGNALAPIFGGIQRLTGVQSSITLQPIIATVGRIHNGFTPPLCNRTLFRRDNHACLYCGKPLRRSALTRDHVIPLSRGGRDRWENVVAACSPCNLKKGSKSLRQCGLHLRKPPRPPAAEELRNMGRKFPPNHLHDSWMDFLYWDAELDA